MDLIKNKLESIAEEISYDPVDADIKFYPDRENKFEITEEKPGLTLDVKELFNDFKGKDEERGVLVRWYCLLKRFCLK
jgi:hypothetical protein